MGRLLILDDDATVGQTLLFGAQACGFEARLCAGLAAFRTELRQWPPTHVVLDLQLAGGSGRAVLEDLTAEGATASVIVCSGAGAIELDAALAEVRRHGLPVAGALAKPFRLAALRALLGVR